MNKPVQIGPVALFEKHATATASPVLIGPVQFGFWSFFDPMDQTFKHLLQPAWALFVFLKLLETMLPDHLMMREDPSTFEVMDLHEYFQDFTDLWECIAQLTCSAAGPSSSCSS